MATRAPHRQLIREFIRSGKNRTPESRAPIVENFRKIIMQKEVSDVHLENTALFLRSQRRYKLLLDRYNPLHDLTSEEHLKATARRVGLNMPKEVPKDDPDSK